MSDHRIARAVDALPQETRTVFHLRFVEELRIPDIAARMNLETSVVREHLVQGLVCCTRALKEPYDEGRG